MHSLITASVMTRIASAARSDIQMEHLLEGLKRLKDTMFDYITPEARTILEREIEDIEAIINQDRKSTEG